MPNKKPLTEITRELYEVLTPKELIKGSTAWAIYTPTLKDVLLKLCNISGKYIHYYIDCFGNLMRVNTEYCAGDHEQACVINLEKSFDNQDEETLRKLHELLITP